MFFEKTLTNEEKKEKYYNLKSKQEASKKYHSNISLATWIFIFMNLGNLELYTHLTTTTFFSHEMYAGLYQFASTILVVVTVICMSACNDCWKEERYLSRELMKAVVVCDFSEDSEVK